VQLACPVEVQAGVDDHHQGASDEAWAWTLFFTFLFVTHSFQTPDNVILKFILLKSLDITEIFVYNLLSLYFQGYSDVRLPEQKISMVLLFLVYLKMPAYFAKL
jgi:hypothetical protein